MFTRQDRMLYNVVFDLTARNIVYTNIIEGDAFRNRQNFGNQNVSKFRKKLKAQN